MGGVRYRVEIESLRASAAGTRTVAQEVRACRPDAAVKDVPAGIPGADAAQAVEALAESWRAKLTAWANGAERYAAHVSASAAAYQASDDAAAADFAQVMPVPRRAQ
ncbi:MAG TPA: type VII secretion target [Kineosporiaceae bacterium]|jgi:hypothetical protein|nr:type VII secretion target [Kineosporiaceae bacterium]